MAGYPAIINMKNRIQQDLSDILAKGIFTFLGYMNIVFVVVKPTLKIVGIPEIIR